MMRASLDCLDSNIGEGRVRSAAEEKLMTTAAPAVADERAVAVGGSAIVPLISPENAAVRLFMMSSANMTANMGAASLHLEPYDQYEATSGAASHAASHTSNWHAFQSWPPLVKVEPLVLQADVEGTAEAVTGRSLRLKNEKDGSGNGESASSSYTYDPADPTPYTGGPSFDLLNSGMRDQQHIEGR
jgi:hypothetical protein